MKQTLPKRQLLSSRRRRTTSSKETQAMLTERLTFRAKYGHGDELATLFREFFARQGAQSGMIGARLYTDATGPMFTVVAEADFADMAAYAAFFAQDASMYADPEFQAWFGRMEAATEVGDRQLFNSEKLL
jgi:hypothetical protein